MTIPRITAAAAAFIALVAFKTTGASAPPETYDASETHHLSGLTAKITTSDGKSRVVTLDGVGGSASICSRTAIKGNTDGHILARNWLDAIASIKDTTQSSTSRT